MSKVQITCPECSHSFEVQNTRIMSLMHLKIAESCTVFICPGCKHNFALSEEDSKKYNSSDDGWLYLLFSAIALALFGLVKFVF